jgi:hypothetical protein
VAVEESGGKLEKREGRVRGEVFFAAEDKSILDSGGAEEGG